MGPNSAHPIRRHETWGVKKIPLRPNLVCALAPNQTYYDVPEQLLIINHALLAFRPYERTVVFNGDIDEFFVPQASARRSKGQGKAREEGLG